MTHTSSARQKTNKPNQKALSELHERFIRFLVERKLKMRAQQEIRAHWITA